MEILKKLKALWADRRPFKKRLALAALPALAAVYTFLFFGPLEMVSFSTESLSYTYLDVLPLLVIFALIIFVVITGAMLLLRGKIFNIAVCTVTALTLAGYLQGALLNGAMGTLTGEAVIWSDKVKAAFLNLLIWIAVFTAIILVMYLSRKIWATAVKWIAIILVVMQFVPTVAILAGAYSDTQIKDIKSFTLSNDGMYEFSKKDNILLITLDTLDYKYVEQIMKEDPDFAKRLSGFTAYTNATSLYARTTPSVAQILSGANSVAFTMEPADYYKNCWTESGKSSLQLISEQGYDLQLYTGMNYTFSDTEQLKYVKNAVSSKGTLKTLDAYKKLTELSFYRYAPTVAKPFFWADTLYFNDVFDASAVTPYVFNDSEYLSGFQSSAVTQNKDSFKFYHFYGAHTPYTLDENGEKSETSTNVLAQTKGCFKKLFAAFDKMKELGIYDDATIIITADHGEHPDYRKVLDHKITIGLFYKPSGKGEGDLEFSAAPVTTDNVIPTVLKAAGADYSAFGKALDEVTEKDTVTRYHYCPLATDKWVERAYAEFEIGADANDFKNWKYLGTKDHVAPY